jgi:alpha-tubulin suppressor-like RCC1 family protein
VAILALLSLAVSASASAAGGSLTVRVVGLPRGERPAAMLLGPHGLRRNLHVTGASMRRAPPGTYQLLLRAVLITRRTGGIESGAKASALHRTVKVRLRRGGHALLEGRYTSILNPGVTTLAGGVLDVTGPPEAPSTVVLRGHLRLVPGSIITMAPTSKLPKGLLARVGAVVYEAGNTAVSLSPASIYEVAPNFQFNVRLSSPRATAAGLSASCGGPSGVDPYRRIKDVWFSGGWSTVDVFGVHVTDGVKADVHFATEAGVDVTGGLGLSCSASVAFYADGMAGPIPVTAGIAGDLHASAAAGGILQSGGSLDVTAGGHTIGAPPALVVIPDVSFSNPHFGLTARTFATASTGIGLAVVAGIGSGGIASLTLHIGASLDFNAEPGACTWTAKFGQFSLVGELLAWHLSTPSTPPLFSQALGGNYCAPSPPSPPPPPTRPPPPPPPPPAPGLYPPAFDVTNASLVDVAIEHSCALLLDRRVACWGSGTTSGQPEYGAGGAITGLVTAPFLAMGVTTARALAVGDDAVCAVVRGGEVECWGWGFSGAIGDGTTNTTDVPKRVVGIDNAVSIASGQGHACAALSTGHVECWGSNDLEQLGTGSASGPDTCWTSDGHPYACSTTPVTVQGLSNVIAVTAGGNQTCALLASARVECWGNSLAHEPALPRDVGVANATAVSVDGWTACALLSSGHVECWGVGEDGALGNGTEIATESPVEVTGVTNATAISSGLSFSCASLSGGSLKCWGVNDHGQLGDGTNEGPEICGSFTKVACSKTPTTVTSLTTAVSVGAGGDDACAVLSTGRVACWGDWNGTIGEAPISGPLPDALTPVSVP